MVDFSAPFNALISQNQQPAPNPLTQVGQMAATQTALSGAQRAESEADDAALQNAQNHVAYIINGMAPVLAKGADATAQDAALAAANIYAETRGRVGTKELSDFIGRLPTDGPGIQKALQQHMLRLQSVNDRINTLRGQTEAYNTGGRTQFGTRNSFTGAFQPQGGPDGQLTHSLSPEAAVSPQSGPPDPQTGAPTTITGGERAEASGLAPSGTYTGRGGGPIQVYVGADGQITRPRQSADGMAPRAGGPMTSGLSPAQSSVIKASGDAYASAQQGMSTLAQREQQLESGLTALQGTSTGPGTESRNAIESYMLALPGGLGRWIPGVDPNSVAAFDTANKYLTAAAAANPSAGRSDAGLSTAIASNPSVHISNQAAQDIQKANLGFVRFEKANMASFGGQDASQWQSHIAQRNASIDPHAYSADLITPSQRAAYMSTLSPSGKAKYLSSIRDAMANGAFTEADLQHGGAGAR